VGRRLEIACGRHGWAMPGNPSLMSTCNWPGLGCHGYGSFLETLEDVVQLALQTKGKKVW